jgi:hypothetical protein
VYDWSVSPILGWIADVNNPHLGTIPGPYISDQDYSEISDLPNGRGMKPVHHIRRKFHYVNEPFFSAWNWAADTTHPTTQRFDRNNSYSAQDNFGWIPLQDHSNIATLYSKSDDALKREALHSFYSVNETDNLTNIIDAEQTVPHGLVGILQSMRQSGLVKGVTGSSLKPSISLYESLLGFVKKLKLLHLSNGFLYYSFGVAPLIADMRKMAIASRSIENALDKYNANAGRLQSAHARCLGSMSHTSLPSYIGPKELSWSSTYWYADLNQLIQPVKTATVIGIKSHKYNTKLFNSVQYLQDKFLSAGPASAIWEKIPYSFVLDWFVDMSTIIDKLDNAASGGVKQVRGCSFSEKWACLSSTIFQNPGRNHEYHNLWGETYGWAELSYYHREAWTPEQLSLSASGRFGKKQVALSAALLHQIVASLKLRETGLKGLIKRG